MATQKIALTDAKLKYLKPQTQQFEIRDAGAPGLRVRVYPSGKITFRWMAKDANGKNIIKTLGTYPETGLAKARTLLETLKEQHAETLTGGGLVGEDTLATVKELAEEFYRRRIIPHRKRPDAVRGVLDLHILPVIGQRKLSSLTTGTCRAVVERVVDAGATTHAGKVLAILKQLMDFGLSRGDMATNPATPLRAENLGVTNHKRDRSLSGDDLRELWHHLDTLPRLSIQTRLAFKILGLTGARTGELLQARWENVDLDTGTWTIPVSDQKLSPKQAKAARPFVIPLVPQVVDLFKQARTAAEGVAENPVYVMASDSKEGHLSDKVLGHVTRRLFKKKTQEGEPLLKMDYFSPHDLRRTVRTHLGQTLRVPPHIAERCLNHSLGRIVATYDTGDYLDERRDALARWADQVDIFTGQRENVVALASGRADG